MISNGILPRSVASELFAGSRLRYFRSSERNSNPGLGTWPSFQIEGSRWSPVTGQRITSRRCAGPLAGVLLTHTFRPLLHGIPACIHAGLKGLLKYTKPSARAAFCYFFCLPVPLLYLPAPTPAG